MDQKMRVAIVGAVFALLALAVVSYSATNKESLPVIKEIGGGFSLVGEGGKPITLEDFRGSVVMLTFGFTTCPDICPTTLFSLKRLRAKLGDAAKDFKVIFVTLDPERDSPDHTAAYAGHFGPGVVGLGGNMQAIKETADRYKTKFFKKPIEGGEGAYTIAHSDFMYLLDAQGRTRAIYHHNDPLENIVADAQKLLDEI